MTTDSGPKINGCAGCGVSDCHPASRTLDPKMVRADFHILNVLVHGGKSIAYLDNAATTQKPQAVVCSLTDYYQFCNANVHRSLHYLAEQATERFERSRKIVRQFINAPSIRNVIFTRGTTESINLVAHSWGRKFLKEGDEILLTEMEHHSNMIPWQMLAKEKGAVLKYIPMLDDGTLDMEAYHKLLSPKVKLVSFVHVSNVLGTVNPAKEIIAAAREIGAVTVVDGAQSVPHQPIDVVDLDCDFFAFSGHKMLGPTGIGVLYGREELLEEMDPFMGGGEMINRVTYTDATWADLPHKFEAGTPHISGAIGMAAGMNYLMEIGMDKISAYEHELTGIAIRKLSEVPGIKIFGHAENRGGAVSFEVDGVHPHDMAQFADKEGVAIRAGHMCAQPLMRKLGVPAVTRASFYFYNLPEEIDRLVHAIHTAKDFFGHGS